MLKQVIKFSNGDYWYCYTKRGSNLQEAWTFNRPEGAQNTINVNKLTDCTIRPVDVGFDPGFYVKEL